MEMRDRKNGRIDMRPIEKAIMKGDWFATLRAAKRTFEVLHRPSP